MSQENEIEAEKLSPTTDFLPSDGAPWSLFHVTSGRKAKLYRQTGRINAPVRGFDTLMAAMAWAMKTGRKVIMQVEPISKPQMLPDHHNDFGQAWWTESIPIERVKCAYSAEGAWPHPDSSANAEPIHELFAVFDRKVDALPTEKCAIEIFTEEKWFTCEWNPRTPESDADSGYLGTARTTVRPIQIGFHAWEQNDSEFRYFCLPSIEIAMASPPLTTKTENQTP